MRLSAYSWLTWLLLACESAPASRRTEPPLPPEPARPSPAAPASAAPPSRPTAAPAAPKTYVLREPDMRRWPRRHGSLEVPPTRYELPAGDGCTTPRIIPVHGFLSSNPIHGSVSLQEKSIAVDIASIETGVKQTHRGTLDESVCGTQSLEYSGKIDANTMSVSLRLPRSLNPPLNSDPGRTRIEIEGRKKPDQPQPMLRLWNAPDDPKNFLAPYRSALKSAVDVYSVVKIHKGSTLIAYSPVASPRLMLAELAGSPLAKMRSIETELVCDDGDECTAELDCHELDANTFVLAVSLSGTSTRGQGTFRFRQGELWTLTAENGFKLGAGLPTAESSNTAHGSRASGTRLYWVDGDGQAPFEILVKHTDSEREGGPHFGLLAFDAGEQTYRPVDPMPPTPREMLTKLSYINAIAEF